MSLHKVSNTILGFEKKISNIILTLLLAALVMVTLLFSVIIYQSYQQREIEVSKEIDTAISLYQYNLSEKLSIIASSVIFSDFYRSGEATRRRLEIRFLTELIPLKSSGIIGYSLVNSEMGTSYEAGKKSEYSLTIKLCYLGDKLDSEDGKCHGSWRLYFSDVLVVNNLSRIKPSIRLCKSCGAYSLTRSGYFGSFPVENDSKFNIGATVEIKNDNAVYYYLIIVLILSAFAGFSRGKLHSLIQRKITRPVDTLIEKIKSHEPLNKDSNALYEINYLSMEIEAGRRHASLINEYEKKAAIGYLAASVAHDIGSPIASMEMILHVLSNEVSVDKISTLRISLQRIRNIADNLLDQYRKSSSISHEENLACEIGVSSHLEPINLACFVEDVVKQKQYEWVNLPCHLNFVCDDSARGIFVNVMPDKVRRILSNLLNNAFEACSRYADIHMRLELLGERLHLSIIDNGDGIPPEKIHTVIAGESLKHTGQGMGLSSAKRYMDSIKGQLNISSHTGVGTTIVLIFIAIGG